MIPLRPQGFSYGSAASQFAEVWSPASPTRPPVVLLHGGWWREQFDLHLMDPLARDLAARGHTVWNIEYRRLGGGGGWPVTYDDVVTAIRRAADEGLELEKTVVIGHSAGGHLGLLAAAALPLAGVVAQAPVTDLVSCAADGLGEGATSLFLGGNDFSVASPRDVLPMTASVLVVHGSADQRVPIEHSRSYVSLLADQGRAVELLEVADGDHFFVLRPDHPTWKRVCQWIQNTQDTRFAS